MLSGRRRCTDIEKAFSGGMCGVGPGKPFGIRMRVNATCEFALGPRTSEEDSCREKCSANLCPNMPGSIHFASYRIRTYRCYFSIDREVGSLRAYPSARRSYPVQCGTGHKRSGYATKRSLGNDEDEVTFAKYLVHALVHDRLTFCRKSLQTRNQPRDCIGDPRVRSEERR